MNRLQNVLSVLLTVAALVIAGVLIKREFFSSASSGQPKAEVTEIQNWEAIRDSVAVPIDPPLKLQQMNAAYAQSKSGQRTSLTKFAIDISVFTDFECPFCRVADSIITQLANRYIVTRHVIHYPLTGIHGQAMAGARALECADREGLAFAMHRVLYENQRELGVTSWGKIGELAAVEDTTEFLRCIESRPDVRIAAGTELAKRLGVSGTPTVLINGWMVIPSTPERIKEVFDAILKRQTPR